MLKRYYLLYTKIEVNSPIHKIIIELQHPEFCQLEDSESKNDWNIHIDLKIKNRKKRLNLKKSFKKIHIKHTKDEKKF